MSVRTRTKPETPAVAVGDHVTLTTWPTDLRSGEVEDVLYSGTRMVARVRLSGPAGHPHAGMLTVVPVDGLEVAPGVCPTCGHVLTGGGTR